MKPNKRILIISVSSWNSKVGSNTWASLLSGYDSANLASICIRDNRSDSDVCSRYFVISENRVLKSLLKRSVKTGYEVEKSVAETDEAANDLQSHNKRYNATRGKPRRYSLLMAREMIWKLGKWKTEELDKFLDSFKPDIILHSMEGYIHLNRIVEYSVKRTGATAIGYIWDDNFTYKQSKKIEHNIYRFFQRKSLKKLSSVTKEFFAITEKTKEEADAFFNINCHLLTKPLNSVPEINYSKGVSLPIRILYTGNLLIGRDKTLIRVVKELLKFPKNSFIIDVYTNTVLNEQVKKELDSDVCRLHSAIPQSEVLEKQKEADWLLFLEDIDGPDSQTARLSFSTKITDYLSAGKAIWAIGCRDVAPMQYFLKNDSAIVSCDNNEIYDSLNMIFDKPQILIEYAEKARISGMVNHSKDKIQQVFDSVIVGASEN